MKRIMWGDERKIRVQAGNLHVCLRGNNRNNVFYVDAERIAFLRHCQRAAIKTNTVIEQFTIMDNHAHLQVRTENVTNFVSCLLKGYVQWYNWKNDTCDRLFSSPFVSFAKYTDAWIVKSMLYILQNPVKKGMCKFPSEYKWCSYNFHFGQKSPLAKYITVNTSFIENYFKTKAAFDRAIKDRIIEMSEIQDAERGVVERITDCDLAKYIFDVTKKENIFHLTKEESIALILKIHKETTASLRQISSLTHESYNHVREICNQKKK